MANNKLAYAIAKANGINTDGMTPQEVWEVLAEQGISVSYPQNTKYEDILNNDEESIKTESIRNDVLQLSKREYAELCSAIRTKHGNKIPAKGKMLYKDSYYWYNYDKENYRITCSDKIKIEGNEEIIAYRRKRDVK